MARGLALIIEDNREIGDIYAVTLHMSGFETELIVDGKVALERLDETTPDLIILDMNLPQVSGHYIYKRIRSDARLKNMPIIISTANILVADALAKEHNPNDHILVKPVSPAQIRDLVRSLS